MCLIRESALPLYVVYKVRGLILTTHLRVIQRLKMNVTDLPPFHVPLWQADGQPYLYLYLIFFLSICFESVATRLKEEASLRYSPSHY
jgi:hypothetical protein